MKKKITIAFFFLSTFVWVMINPDLVLATQVHGTPEGVYAHQIAHIFFLLSMGFLIHWLRERELVRKSGWRFIQYAAFFLILWNMDAFLVHFLNDQLQIVQVQRVDSWHIQLSAGNGRNVLNVLFYFAKLDHLFCVPALLFLYFGLRRLLKESHSEITEPENQRNSQL